LAGYEGPLRSRRKQVEKEMKGGEREEKRNGRYRRNTHPPPKYISGYGPDYINYVITKCYGYHKMLCIAVL